MTSKEFKSFVEYKKRNIFFALKNEVIPEGDIKEEEEDK